MLIFVIFVFISNHFVNGTIERRRHESHHRDVCRYDIDSPACQEYLGQDSTLATVLNEFAGQLDTAVVDRLKKSSTARVLVTFERGSLDQGSDPAFMLKYYQEKISPYKSSLRLGSVSFAERLRELNIDSSKNQNLASFEKSSLAHLVRGYWVYESAKSASASTYVRVIRIYVYAYVYR